MVSNNVHYFRQLDSPKLPAGRWGSVQTVQSTGLVEEVAPNVHAAAHHRARKNHAVVAFNAIPPSIRRAYTRLRRNDLYGVTGPVYRVSPEYKSTVLSEAWNQCIKTVTVHTMTAVDDVASSIPLSIPLSTVEHENEQLRIGRRSTATGKHLGECCEEQNCEALGFVGNNKPLHPYLTPSQELDFQRNGTLVEGMCLLDIRKTITNVVSLHRDYTFGVDVHNKLPMRVPFYNSVNAPGGYRVEHTIGPNTIMFMQGHVVAHDPGRIHFVPTSIDETGIQCGYFHQGKLIWQNAPEAEGLN
jgi:hypothetical protein